MPDDSIPAETPCAGCTRPIGARAWKSIQGRIYHEDCEHSEAKYGPRRAVPKPLGRHAEEAARRVLRPGQQTLDGEAD